MLDKQALEYLVNLGEVKILDIEGHKYTTSSVSRVQEPKPAELTATTLTALIDYLKIGFDKKASEKLLVHIINPSTVSLYSEIRADKGRETYLICKALTPTIHFDRFIDTETFNIMLQSSFVDNEDKEILLKVTGCVQDKQVMEVGDDGVSQAVTIKTGVAQVGNVLVPNPVELAPYRTFPEIEQVPSRFIFRMKSGPSAAIFEADGGAWRNETMKRIKEYLEMELDELKFVKVIS